jgi:hypothetical protein
MPSSQVSSADFAEPPHVAVVATAPPLLSPIAQTALMERAPRTWAGSVADSRSRRPTWSRLGLALIVLGAVTLAAYWAFLVPIGMAPDEPGHWDYAMCMVERGGLYRARNMPPIIPHYLVHPQAKHLWFASGGDHTFQSPSARAPADYGRPEFFAKLNATAPVRSAGDYRTPPCYVAFYTYGYYGLLALWIGAMRLFTSQVVALYFGSRLFNVVLLALSLILSYKIARKLGFSAAFALCLTATIGFFPMTTFVSAYIQPDNLSFTLVSLSLYLALLARQQPDKRSLVAWLGIALGALLVTKQHFYLCCLVPIVTMLATQYRHSGLGARECCWRAVLLFLPSVLFGIPYLWSIWGTRPYYSASAGHPGSAILYVVDGFKRAFFDFYSGTTHCSFYGIFGCLDTPLVIKGDRTTEFIFIIIQSFSYVLIGLTLWRLEQVGSRLLQLWHKGRRMMALRIACSNPVLNSYFVFTLFMFFIYIRTDNHIGAQGRNWLPFMVPMFLTSLVYAPRALTLRRVQRIASLTVASALIVFTACGSYYGVRTIKNRFYVKGHEPSVSMLLSALSPPERF